MARSCNSILQAILLFSSLLIIVRSESRDLYLTRVRSPSFSCLTTANASASFLNHVNLLLSDFNVQSSLANYYNTSIGRSPDTVYGYFMCRADTSHQECKGCIQTGTQLVTKEVDCDQVHGILFSGMCIFRYSNESMYGVWDPFLHSTHGYLGLNVSNYEQFNRTLSPTLETLINKTAFGTKKDESKPLFATMEADVMGNQTIYSLAQCTPDISATNCSQCLRFALSRLRPSADGSPAAISVMPKCQLRYDNVSFYNFGQSNFGMRKNSRTADFIVLFYVLLLLVNYLFN